MRIVEVVLFLLPLAAFLLWRAAVRRGLDGPSPRNLLGIVVVLLLVGAGLAALAVRDRLPPGRYVPAALEHGRIVPGHAG